MAVRSRDFVGIAEGIKGHELSTKGKIEQLKGRISELSGRKSSLNGTISYLEAAIDAAYEDTDEDGDPDYALIASLEAEKRSTKSELADVEQDLDSTGGELEQSEDELEEVLEEKAQTLFEIQERARTTSQNIVLAGGMYGAYSGVGETLQNSMQTSLSVLTQAASILDGAVDMNGVSGGGNITSGASNTRSLNGSDLQSELSTSPLSAFVSDETRTGIAASSMSLSASQFLSGQTERSTPGMLPNFHSGQATINTQKPLNFISKQDSNIYMASSLNAINNDDTVRSDSEASVFQSKQESPRLEDNIRMDLEKRRKWAAQYKVNTPILSRGEGVHSDNADVPSRGQRERQIVEETGVEYDEIDVGGIVWNTGVCQSEVEDSVSLAEMDITYFHNNEELYYYDDMSRNPKLSFVDPRTVLGLKIGDETVFWNYKGKESKERYIELAKEIDAVKMLHNTRQMSYEQIAQLGGVVGACAQYYFSDNAIRVEKVGNAYIFQDDGRHRLQAAIDARIEKIPIMIVGEHKVKERLLNPSIQYKSIENSLKRNNVSYRPVALTGRERNSQEIVRYLSGGDNTDGSCSSLALAYVGNKAGYDVLDFRGGESRAFFSSRTNIEKIINLPSVKSFTIYGNNDVISAYSLLNEMIPGKEYYLATGQHAAIVRKSGDYYEYLELQHPSIGNGWHVLDTHILKNRFKCSTIRLTKNSNYLIETDSLANNEEFISLLGYINTVDSEQKKGIGGHVK